MYRSVQLVVLFLIAVVGVIESAAQSQYQVISVVNGGTVSGSVRWTGPVLHSLAIPISKDQEICDPEHHKSADLERIVIGPSAHGTHGRRRQLQPPFSISQQGGGTLDVNRGPGESQVQWRACVDEWSGIRRCSPLLFCH